jgi:hypothetical protein
MTGYKSEMDGYDGILFLPNDNPKIPKFDIKFIKYKEDFGSPVEENTNGSKYHVAFFQRGDDGEFVFAGTFESIFSDPIVYVKGLNGSNVYGTIVRKHEKTSVWFKEYVKDLITALVMLKEI